MEPKDIEALIRFHKEGLIQYRHLMGPSAQYLEEQTVKALEELKNFGTALDEETRQLLDKG